MTDYAVDLVERLHDIHHFIHQHLKVASDWMKARYDQLANSAGFQEDDSVADLPYPEERKITQATDGLGSPLHHNHLDKCHILDSAASQGKDDGRPPGQTGTIPGGYSRRVALRREQCNRGQ